MFKYPRLYSIVAEHGSTLIHAGMWNNGRWEWKLGLRRNLFVWEENQVTQLLLLVENKKVDKEGESVIDSWIWISSSIFQ